MSQCNQILKHLKRYGSITPMSALDGYGCMRLAARVNELKARGFNIYTKIITKNNKRFAKYFLAEN